MIIKQLSIFLENKVGRLAAAMKLLGDNGIDISALSLADSADFGVLRLIVSDPAAGQKILQENGITVRITDMVAVAFDDVPGSAAKAISLLADNGISIEYMYACIGSAEGKALMVVRADDKEKAESVLEANGMNAHALKEIYRI